MLDEIVKFSRELENNNIYKRITEENKNITIPILVLPAKDDLSDFDYNDIYIVVKNIVKENLDNGKIKDYLILDNSKIGKPEIKYEIKKNIQPDNLFKNISSFNKEFKWQSILYNVSNLTRKPSNDNKGNKSIGQRGNSGTNSYNLLIFCGKFKNDNTESTNKIKGDIFYSFDHFFHKTSDTYADESKDKEGKKIRNLIKDVIPETVEEKSKFIHLLTKLSKRDTLKIIWEKINEYKNYAGEFKERNWLLPNGEMYFIIKLPDQYFSYYKAWYEKYLSKNIFKTMPKNKKYPLRKCSIIKCENNDKCIDTWLPNAFHNLDQKKPFLCHIDRKFDHNIALCGNCSLHLFKFQEFFLNDGKFTIFPLFIDEIDRKQEVSIFTSGLIKKLNFKNIIKSIYRSCKSSELNFYLVIYNNSEKIISFDYVSNYRFLFRKMSVFQIEKYFSCMLSKYDKARSYYTNILEDNYFNSKIETQNSFLDNCLYKYRTLIFDFVYRAKYNSLNNNNILDIFITSMKFRLKELYNPDIKEINVIKKIYEIINYYQILDENFGGKSMDTVNSIKQTDEINDIKSFAFYLGQVVYYLLKQSEKEDKMHSMVEPFIDLPTINRIAVKLQSTFKAYSHKISLTHPNFNKIFKQIWAFIVDHKDVMFSNDLKYLFYAGYFDSDSNIIYKQKEKKNESK